MGRAGVSGMAHTQAAAKFASRRSVSLRASDSRLLTRAAWSRNVTPASVRARAAGRFVQPAGRQVPLQAGKGVD